MRADFVKSFSVQDENLTPEDRAYLAGLTQAYLAALTPEPVEAPTRPRRPSPSDALPLTDTQRKNAEFSKRSAKAGVIREKAADTRAVARFLAAKADLMAAAADLVKRGIDQ